MVVFLHGFGCGQGMWRLVAPAFEAEHRVLLMDLPGAADSDPTTYDAERHASLEGYAEDVLQVLDELGLEDVTVVGHSVASMIAVLAQLAAPRVVTRLVLLTPSACYLDDGVYHGGFGPADIDDLLAMMERNQLGWQAALSGMVAGDGHDDARGELEDSFCRTRPEVALQFAAVTFRSDNRSDLAQGRRADAGAPGAGRRDRPDVGGPIRPRADRRLTAAGAGDGWSRSAPDGPGRRDRRDRRVPGCPCPRLTRTCPPISSMRRRAGTSCWNGPAPSCAPTPSSCGSSARRPTSSSGGAR